MSDYSYYILDFPTSKKYSARKYSAPLTALLVKYYYILFKELYYRHKISRPYKRLCF